MSGSWSSRFSWASTHIITIEISERFLHHCIICSKYPSPFKFPHNFYLETKAVQLHPALGIVFLSSYSLWEERATSKFWQEVAFHVFSSVFWALLFPKWSNSTAAGRAKDFLLQKENFLQGQTSKLELANLKEVWVIDESKLMFWEIRTSCCGSSNGVQPKYSLDRWQVTEGIWRLRAILNTG